MAWLNPIQIYEEAMANIGNNLKIKYGLKDNPSEKEILRWVEITISNIRRGMGSEAAGHSAAKSLFSDYQTRMYASEADTIAQLLEQAGDK